MKHRLARLSRRSILLIGLAGVVVGVLLVTMVYTIPAPLGIDWRNTYRPATLALLRGHNPYDIQTDPASGFFIAPWGVIPLIPLALLPMEVGRAALVLVGLLAFAYTARQLGAGPAALAVFLLSPPVLHCLVNANIEWLTLLGFVLPPQAGLLFIMVKPQTGFAVGVFWFVEAWRKGGGREVVRIFAPVTMVFLLSCLLYGLWPLRLGGALVHAARLNASFWPATIPVGLGLMVAAIRQQQIRYALPASPCLSPYVLFHSWSSAVVALVTRPAELMAVVIGLWLLVLIHFVV